MCVVGFELVKLKFIQCDSKQLKFKTIAYFFKLLLDKYFQLQSFINKKWCKIWWYKLRLKGSIWENAKAKFLCAPPPLFCRIKFQRKFSLFIFQWSTILSLSAKLTDILKFKIVTYPLNHSSEQCDVDVLRMQDRDQSQITRY